MRSKRHATFAVQTPTVTRRVYPQKRPIGEPALRDAPPGGIMCISDALVAQPDRASDYESEGRRFESCRARQRKSRKLRENHGILRRSRPRAGVFLQRFDSYPLGKQPRKAPDRILLHIWRKVRIDI